MAYRLRNLFLILVIALTFSTPGYAQQGGLQPTGDPLTPTSFVDSKIPKVSAPGAPAVAHSVEGFQRVSVIVTFDAPVDAAAIAQAAGGEVVYRYTKVFDGASIVLAGDAVAQLAALDGVAEVYLDEILQPQTDVSPDFIGAPAAWTQLGGQESAGEGVVVGVLDTGIWPEHPSFSDPDPSGKTYAPPQVQPGANGFAGAARSTCDFGNSTYNPNDDPFTCNNKLIGAYKFLDTYKTVFGLLPEEFDSARDDNGHGTHTSSTAAGNAGVSARLFGIDRGVVSGIAPRAQVIMYRVCAGEGCFTSDSAAAVEQAILDGVDALNFSIGGGNNPYTDLASLAFLKAYENGVFVAASAGNSGPGPNTTGHREPWVTTVAAGTSNRHFLNAVTLTAGGETLTLQGASVTPGIDTPTPVIFAPGGPTDLCLDPFPAGTFNGEIVICRRGVNARVEKGYNVLAGGASGMILYNPSQQGLATDNHFLPAVHLDGAEGEQLLAFMSGHSGVTAVLTAGTATPVPGDVTAAFSSRGGSGLTLGIAKPDITAPGVQILAGNTPMPATVDGGKPGELFQAIQGTSMSSPHIAGSAALLRALHPDWTPGQIKSALMTSAFGGVFKEDGLTPADPFDVGSGRVDLTRAGNPGLTFDETGADYRTLKDELWNSNYPSLYVPEMPGILTVERTVTSVLGKTVKWRAFVEAPADVKVVRPRSFRLEPGASHTFKLTVDASRVPLGEVRFATLTLKANVTKQQTITVRFPITIVRREALVSMTKTCDPATIVTNTKDRTTCTITLQNNGLTPARVSGWDPLPRGLSLVPDSITGGYEAESREIAFDAELAPALPPGITVTPDTNRYLPLSLFAIPPIENVGDDMIINFTVPEFQYAGLTYARIGMVTNGYAVVGGGGADDVRAENQSLPDPAAPNNVLAAFWTDLNPAAGGALRAATLTEGAANWLVLDWQDVPNFTDGAPNSFQIWIRLGETEEIRFVYGGIGGGDQSLLTIGAENDRGSSGANFYYNGVGSLPGGGVGVLVRSAPAAPGGVHTVTFQAKGGPVGVWRNCAYMTGDTFQGVSVDCFEGETLAPGD